MFATIMIRVFTIFAMMGVGIIANKKGILPTESSGMLSNFLINVPLPMMVLAAMMNRELNPSLMTESIHGIIVSAFGLAVSLVFSIIFVKLLHYNPSRDNGVLMAILVSSNTAFMGYPITNAVFGEKMFYLVVLCNLPWTTYLYSILRLQMGMGTGAKFSLKTVGKAFLTLPVLATFVGVFFLFAQIQVPDPIYDFISTIGAMTTPLSMMIIGVQLGNSRPRDIIRNGKLVLTSLANVILMPIVAFLAINWLPVSNDVKVASIFMFAFPAAVAVSALAEEDGHNAQLGAEGVTLTTLFSIVTLPIVAIFLQLFYLS